jgi:hypothetical protein
MVKCMMMSPPQHPPMVHQFPQSLAGGIDILSFSVMKKALGNDRCIESTWQPLPLLAHRLIPQREAPRHHGHRVRLPRHGQQWREQQRPPPHDLQVQVVRGLRHRAACHVRQLRQRRLRPTGGEGAWLGEVRHPRGAGEIRALV